MKKISRRRFLQISGLAAGASMLPLPVKWLGRNDAFAFYQSPANKIPLYSTALRGVGPSGIPVAIPDGSTGVGGAAHYTINVEQFQDAGVCPTLGPTTLWGYNPQNALGVSGVPTQKHLGGIVVAEKGVPIQLTVNNNLPSKHILPVDKSAFFPDAQKHENDCTVHLHGGHVPWISDGGPMTAFTPAAQNSYGASIKDAQGNILYSVLNPNLQPGQGEYYYPNDQSARMMWYHDHAHDTTRVNAYAGIATAYLLRDNFERSLINMGLPDFIENGGNEIPLVFQDKIFVGTNIGLFDPTWTGVKTPGSLWYPHIYEPSRWRRSTGLSLPNPSVIPEMFGDTMLVNGTVFPEAAVEARRYRLRILNACQARFMNLQLYVDDGSLNGITLDMNPASKNFGNPTNQPFLNQLYGTGSGQPAVLQIGTEGGFLPNPVLVPTNMPFDPMTFTGSLFMGPAERADLIIDFSQYAGKNIILYTDAPAPFPMGDPRNDYFPGLNTRQNPINGQTKGGYGPNTRILMRFKVSAASSSDPKLSITTATDLRAGNDPLFTVPPAGTPRQLTLNEGFDSWGRLIQMLGTDQMNGAMGFGRMYMDAATENVTNNTSEIWEIYNLTGDVHPMHFHLVNCQLLNRQPIDVAAYMAGQPGPGGTTIGKPVLLGPATGPDPNETGWKETVRMYPGTVTRIMMTFNLPTVPFNVPASPRTGGHEYVWHCHILEHEEHDMMRPMIVA